MSANPSFSRMIGAPEALALLSPHPLPHELAAEFDEEPRALYQFDSLTEAARRRYCRYVDEAKSATMRARRAALITMVLMALPS